MHRVTSIRSDKNARNGTDPRTITAAIIGASVARHKATRRMIHLSR
jgi:hypothetical protein